VAETYTIAIERTGSPGIKAAAELQSLHRKASEEGGLHGFLARSLIANKGLVYTKKTDPSKPFSWESSGMLIIYAEDFFHISYRNGKVQYLLRRLASGFMR
jgi:hypothetical protein